MASREDELRLRVLGLNEQIELLEDEIDKLESARAPLQRELRRLSSRSVDTSEAETVPPELMKKRMQLQSLLIFFTGEKIVQRTGWKPLKAYFRQIQGKISPLRSDSKLLIEEELLEVLNPALTDIKNEVEKRLRALLEKI